MLRVAYIYIYITTVSFIDSFRLESVSIEGNRATVATLHRLLIPKLRPHEGRPSLSLYIYIFIDSCRQAEARFAYFLFFEPTNLGNTNLDLRRNVSFYFVSEATDFSKCSSLRKLEAWKKGNGEKERKEAKKKRGSHRRRETVRSAGCEFRGCEITGNCEKRSCKEKLRRIKKRRS